MMIDKAKILFTILIFFIILFQSMEIYYYKNGRDQALKQVSTLADDIHKQNSAVEQMKHESEKQITRLLAAQKEAESVRNNYNKKAQKLLAATVSKNCEKAIQWGIDQGEIIYQCWRVNC